MNISLNDIADKLRFDGVELMPATDTEINTISSMSGKYKLPLEYTKFLKLMGNGTLNGFLRGESCFIDELPSLKKWSVELLEENNFEGQLNEFDFVFWMSQGYQFAFFKLDEGDNPPIYYFREGANLEKFIKITDSFTEFLHRLQIKDKLLFDI